MTRNHWSNTKCKLFCSGDFFFFLVHLQWYVSDTIFDIPLLQPNWIHLPKEKETQDSPSSDKGREAQNCGKRKESTEVIQRPVLLGKYFDFPITLILDGEWLGKFDLGNIYSSTHLNTSNINIYTESFDEICSSHVIKNFRPRSIHSVENDVTFKCSEGDGIGVGVGSKGMRPRQCKFIEYLVLNS